MRPADGNLWTRIPPVEREQRDLRAALIPSLPAPLPPLWSRGPGAQVAVGAGDDAPLGDDGRGPLANGGAGAGAAVEDHLAGLAVDRLELACGDEPDQRLV